MLSKKTTTRSVLLVGAGYCLGYIVARTQPALLDLSPPREISSPKPQQQHHVVDHVADHVADHVVADEAGWKKLHIYYGNQDHLQVSQQISQSNQDEYVVSMLSNKRDGFFLDLASNDATSLSNTFTLERDYGWTGST